MELVVNKKDLKLLIKEAIREVIEEDKIEFFLNSFPSVSFEEMKDIENLYGKPKKRQVAFSQEIEI